ncbi:hypothetical protein MO973_02900 [Paenibacillus sp. TRM 82003]|nr:hypothetical protein [Paenibacillus sp. TRM 82003]
MTDWARKYTPVHEERALVQKQFNLKKIEFDQAPTDISDLALFFLAGCNILDERMLVALYARSEVAQKMILDHIAPHFKNVKVVYVENEIEVIQMQYPKSESVDLFNNSRSGLKTVIGDLYRTTDMRVWKAEKKREINYYAVEKEQLDKQAYFASPELQTFITEAYLKSDETLVLIPTGWKLDESLKRSTFLSFITSFIPAVTLLVDEYTSEVVALELSKIQ